MSSRKKLIEEVIGDFHAIKNKMHAKMISGYKGNITYSQQFALLLISQYKDAGMKEISNMLCTSSSAATQLVNELVKQGYVTRTTNQKDRRALDLDISSQGHKKIAEMKKRNFQIMSALFKALSDKELKHFLNLNKKILDLMPKDFRHEI